KRRRKRRVPESRLHFSGRVRHALNDENLQRALTSAMTGIRGRRDAGFADFDFTKGREDLKRRRRANLDRLPELARQFAERLEAVGGQVHFAADAAEARDIIGQLCWNAAAEHAPGAGVRPVVTKVKSMASEEIELNPYLESLGMEVVETDLGERMVQLSASYEDAIAQLRMLTRSGTGQRITSYVNWITGPSRSADIEQSLTIGVHGPRKMHCVILDNGRERMRDDPIFRDALTCIRCGACSNACPPFMAVGGHQFGHIY